MPMPVDWSLLPSELLTLVFQHTKPCAIDLINIASVCKSWLSAASFIVLPKRLPLLLTHTLNSKLPEPYFQHQNPFCSRIHRTRIPAWTASFSCMGSSQGWLGLIDTKQGTQTVLINPTSGAVIVLPLLKYRPPRILLPKLCLSSPDPEHDPNCILLLTPYFLYIRPAVRDSEWRSLASMQGDCVNITSYNGDFYALCSTGVVRIMVDGKSTLRTVRVADPCLVEVDLQMAWSDNKLATNLVVLPPGRLIMVRRQRLIPDIVDIREKDLRLGGSDWEKVRSLGDWTLFMGCNSGVALSASEGAGAYDANAVYFAYCFGLDCVHCDTHSLRVYSLQDQAIRKVKPLNTGHAAVWIQPNLIRA